MNWRTGTKEPFGIEEREPNAFNTYLTQSRAGERLFHLKTKR